MTGPQAPSDTVVWHDLECGSYTADLPLWHELAEGAAGAVLDVGAGTGRVAIDLAGHGHEVVALDHDPELIAELRRRAAGLPVEAVQADARAFDLGRRFPLVLVPMQTLQVLGGAPERAAFLGCAREHLEPGGVLAASLAVDLQPFEGVEAVELPLPDVAEHDSWVYASQPVSLRAGPAWIVVDHVRQVVAPDGTRTESRTEVRLAVLDPDTLSAEARDLGFSPLPSRSIAPTLEHVGTEVAMLRAT